MGLTNHGRLGNGLVGNEGTLHFGCSDAVTANVEDVIDASNDEMVSVLIPINSVAGKVISSVWFEVGHHVALVVTQARASHSWPWFANSENSLDATFWHIVVVGKVFWFDNFAGLRVQNNRIDAVHWQGATSWLHWGYTRKICNDVTSSFCLPVSIHNSALGSTNHLVVPAPSFGIDWFTDAAQNFQGTQIILSRNFITKSHQGPNSSWSSVEDIDLVALNHIPVATCIRV
mmetsp:Transcript_8162/g.12610  ORF Transcript_8162/g.12610 Transcript_8162/m.12610 type:complete len:231 (-) Transcript_8162:1294-1986(-)